ncbi:hypothetical protein RND81_07G042400 [Saponaria officinalis]|uniref:J domain-containing protein n=1 Tax=Saponaria officinalis TaxID=3572 RepID=A0AAW1JLP9_SAPOF
MEVNEMITSDSYYGVLNLRRDSSDEDIRRAYRKLAMQWHPDKWAKTPALLGEAKQKFQKIQEAYSVLSDPRKRLLYDAGMYDHTEEDDEGFCDFMQEMWSLMSQVKKEEVATSMDDLQSMLAELVQGFDTPQWHSNQSADSRWGYGNLQQRAERNEQTSDRAGSTFGVLGMSSCCR